MKQRQEDVEKVVKQPVEPPKEMCIMADQEGLWMPALELLRCHSLPVSVESIAHFTETIQISVKQACPQ